jgi:thiamine kinase-like enzyme
LESTYGGLLNQSEFLLDRTNLIELSGGLTNRNIKVETPRGNFVARISSNESAYLSIDRQSEYSNSKVAAEAGVGAQVFDYLPGKGLLVIGFLEGHSLNSNQVASTLNRIAGACRTLHSASPFDRDFNMFEVQQRYLSIVLEKGFRDRKSVV